MDRYIPVDKRDAFLRLLTLMYINIYSVNEAIRYYEADEEDKVSISYDVDIFVYRYIAGMMNTLSPDDWRDIHMNISRATNGSSSLDTSALKNLINVYLAIPVPVERDYDPYACVYESTFMTYRATFTMLSVLGYPPSMNAVVYTISQGREEIFRDVLPTNQARVTKAIKHILQLPYLTPEQWHILVSLNFSFCVSPEIARSALTELLERYSRTTGIPLEVFERSTGVPEGYSLTSPGIISRGSTNPQASGEIYMYIDSYIKELIQDPLSKMLCNLKGMVSYILPEDKIIQLLEASESTCLQQASFGSRSARESTCLQAVHIGDKIDDVIRFVELSRYMGPERTSVYEEEGQISYLKKIREAILAIKARGTYTGVMSELSLQPTTGRFPGGEEYRQAREQGAALGLGTLSRQEIQDMLYRWNTQSTKVETIQQIEEGRWNDIIRITSRAGIIPFITSLEQGKREALQIITNRIRDILDEISTTNSIDRIRELGILFNITIPAPYLGNLSRGMPYYAPESIEQENIQEARTALRNGIISWADRITLDIDWDSLIRIMNALGITKLPDTPERFATYLQEYITQY